MTPQLAILIAELLLKYGPGVAQGVAEIFSKTEHTLQDWIAVLESARTYEQIMAAAKERAAASPIPLREAIREIDAGLATGPA